MSLGSLFKAVVTSGMSNGFRRAGVSLQNGTNELQLNEQQVKVFENDPHMKIDVVDVIKDTLVDVAASSVMHIISARLGLPVATVVNVVKLVDELRQDETLKDTLVDGIQQTATDAVTNTIENKVSDVVENVLDGLDLSTADEFLHPIIQIIDVLNSQAPLAKKPAVKDLPFDIESDGHVETMLPTAAQRDEAWAWYQANVLVANAAKATENSDA